MTPVRANVYTNGYDPFDPAQCGGDAFDLSVLSSHPLVAGSAVDLANIRYIRLTDVLGDGSERDSAGGVIYDPSGQMVTGLSLSADIDALCVIHGVLNAPGDADRNGLVDQRDYAAWFNHNGSANASWTDADFDGNRLVDQRDYGVWFNANGSVAAVTPVPEPASIFWAVLACVAAGVRRWRRS